MSRGPRRTSALAALCLVAACASQSPSALEDTRCQIASGVALLADPESEGEQRVDLCRGAVAANRRTIVARNLALGEREEAAFWPLYDRYHAEIRNLDDRLVKLIETFALEKDDPEGSRVLPMIEEAISIREGRLAVFRRYMGSFEAVLPPPTLLRYFQIETRLDAVVGYELARHVPLAP